MLRAMSQLPIAVDMVGLRLGPQVQWVAMVPLLSERQLSRTLLVGFGSN